MKIFKFTVIVATISLLSRVVGFFREAIIASRLGATQLADSVFLSLTVPHIFQFVLGAAVANSIIPLISEKDGIREKSRLFNGVLDNFVKFLSLLALLVLIIVIVLLNWPDLLSENEKTMLKLISFSLPAAILIAISMLYKQLLQFNDRVVSSNIGQLILNVIVIVYMYLTYSVIPTEHSLFQGMALGALISLVFQYYFVKNEGYAYSRKYIGGISKEAIYMSFTIMLGLLMNQLYLITNRLFAASLSDGSVASLSYAEKVIQLPLGIVAQSLGIVIYPLIAKKVANDAKSDTQKIIQFSIEIIYVTSLPLALFIYFRSKSIVELLFLRGEFDYAALELTSSALQMFAMMLLGQSLIMILTRYFYSVKQAKIPLYTMAVTVVVNIILCVMFKNYMGASGIALSNSISTVINAILLIFYMKRDGININFKFSYIIFTIGCFSSFYISNSIINFSSIIMDLLIFFIFNIIIAFLLGRVLRIFNVSLFT
ncbi:lipid II flippase MurJ [Bacillus sp. CBEL-1]|uniref:lipid II flippase MurJ n=1 Tax=Bacillus sp. CBEL-1 TaxID=2502980 RepID=UPI0010496724|nr:lipid II flippase MurJ [Bacillus sp. CBEL-1]TDB55455.1 hypothetical protein EPL02_04390 [Bacillus sp. CBEL-1]